MKFKKNKPIGRPRLSVEELIVNRDETKARLESLRIAIRKIPKYRQSKQQKRQIKLAASKLCSLNRRINTGEWL